GVADPKWGQAAAAVVVARGNAPTSEELETFLRSRVGGFKVPRRFVVWESLPRTHNGKLQRSAVRARLVSATVPR
ncbi:MAG TPA: hypothetical protein VGB18_07285, partial [Candidatus Thermoplasmatota archaeon]